MDSLLLIANPGGVITHANELAVTRLGPVVGRALDGLINAETARLILRPPNHSAWKGVVLFKGLSDAALSAIVSSLSVHENGTLHSIVLVIQDAELENAEREALLRELLAGTSHGLNNPLAIVTGYTDLLLDDPVLARSQREKLESIHRNALRASSILRGLTTFVKRRRSQRTRTQINTVVDAVLSLKAYDLEACGIELETHYDENLPLVVVDSGQLQQVLLNILNNAQEAFTTEVANKKITVRTEMAEDDVIIRVADSGSGISQANLKGIFEPFVSSKSSDKWQGLGLFIANRIIEEHGGHIRIASVDGKGTEVTVQLPVAPILDEPGWGKDASVQEL